MKEMEKTPATGRSNVSTTFEDAFTTYFTSLPDKKNTKRLIFDGLTTSGQVNPEWIKSFVEEIEAKMSQKMSMRIFNRIVKPMITAMKEYYGIIDTMCQANPYPAALIWGSLKIIFDCADRFSSLFETIKQQLEDLTFHLERINFFDELYKDASMQKLLCRSYINVLRFWARVRKECERNMFNMFLKSAGPFSTRKMDTVILDLKKDAEEIKDRADMLEKGRAQTERETNAHHRVQGDEDRRVHLYDRVKQWLSVRAVFHDILEANHRRHDNNRAVHAPGTSEWVFQTTEFQEWSGASPKSPVIWMSGDPGTGKSMICSRVIQHIQDKDTSAAIAFHFFRFDQETSTIDLLRVMTGQLLESLRQSTKDVPDSVLSLTETLGASVQNVMDMMKAITYSPNLPRTFLFIDGLDEELSESRWTTAQETLQMLIMLVTSNSEKHVRLWVSSQAHNMILKTMGKYPRIHLIDQNERDIRLLFENGMRELEQELDDIDTTAEEREHWFELLKTKAKGNFLWAHYMIHSIGEDAESIADIESLITNSLPKDLNEYYSRQFKRISTSNRNLASKIFSIVCFSRRLVSASELSDAIGVIRNPNASSKAELDRRRPRLKLIQNLLSPLIVEEKGSYGAEKRYRLFHSTVKEFVKNNPGILRESNEDAENMSISPSILAELCLQYLSQSRYSTLLEKVDGEWRTASGDSLDKDSFLRYSAKYWYYHLEDVAPSTSLAEKISTFLKSTNFQTLLQIQHLYVDRQFFVFTIKGKPETSKFLKKALPNWFVKMVSRNPDMHFSQDYRVFLHEWNHLLGCGCCKNPFCTGTEYAGEIDRCIFGALGANNFMSSMRSRYTGFALSTNDKDGIRTTKDCYEGYSACGRVVYMVQFETRSPPTLYFVCETWQLVDFGKPRLQQRQKLEVSEVDANWDLYFKTDDANIKIKPGGAKPIAFDYNAHALRIGSQLLIRDENGLFQTVHVDSDQKSHFPNYFEEFLSQGKFIITASRRKAPVPSEERARDMIDNPVLDVGKLFDDSWEKQAEGDSEDSELADDDESSSEASESDTSLSSARTGVHWSSGDETWSEGSTDVEEEINDENAIVFFRGYIDSSSSSESEPSESSSSSDDDESDANSDDGGLGATPHSRFLRGFIDDDSDGDDAYVPMDESDGDSDGRGALILQSRYGRAFRKSTKSDLEASLRVFSRTAKGLKCVFQLSRPLSLVLYDSPPVLHPSKPLIIWSMSPGNVLFADFEQKTWFTRKLRPTTTFTRQVFTKFHFSECGNYVHIAILEARRKPPKVQKRQNPSNGSQPTNVAPLELSLFVTTHRLSSHKTTRAPPTQIHRIKVDLGQYHSLPVSQLPFTLTWTPAELYFTFSSPVLTVLKVKLFPGHDGEEPAAVTRKPIFLPGTADTREVRFFPGSAVDRSQGEKAMLVLIGSQIRSSRVLLGERNLNSGHSDGEGGFQVAGTAWIPQTEAVRGVEGSLSMLAGFYLSTIEDFGGWVTSDDIVDVPADRGVGHLDSKVERFDVEEDCDLEPYIL